MPWLGDLLDNICVTPVGAEHNPSTAAPWRCSLDDAENLINPFIGALMKKLFLCLSALTMIAGSGAALAGKNDEARAHEKRQQAAAEQKRTDNNRQVNNVSKQQNYERTRPSSTKR